jgi:hydroxymethylpyrimidine pyrophosphatase-like HAD family hydrolase
MVNEDTEGMKDIMDQINEYCINLQCVRSEDSIYTITHVNAVKGKTLEYLINLLGIKKEEVMVFGDNFNDMTMFEIAGISVAMENSQNEVKEKADYQAGSNNHNGVSAFLKKIYRI